MFPVMSRLGHVGLFISVVGKNTTSRQLMFLTKFTAKEKRVLGKNAGELLCNK